MQVYRVLSADCRVLALKRVVIEKGDASALTSYANEIDLLRRLRGDPAIITLEDAEVDARRGVIHVVMELGEIDLNQLLLASRTPVTLPAAPPSSPRQQQQRQPLQPLHSAGSSSGHYATAAAAPTAAGTLNSSANTGECNDESVVLPGGLSPHFVRLTWLQMLEAVRAMHAQRVVHGDLKPANFVFCRGALKLIDFGIAKALANDTANISREAQVGTVNYMCPEALLDTGKGSVDPLTGRRGALMKLGTPSDVW